MSEKDEALEALNLLAERFDFESERTAWMKYKLIHDKLSALTAPVDNGWRPIETAPEPYNDYYLVGGFAQPSGAWKNAVCFGVPCWEHHKQPTHWMPLPPPPGAQREDTIEDLLEQVPEGWAIRLAGGTKDGGEGLWSCRLMPPNKQPIIKTESTPAEAIKAALERGG